MNKVKSGFLFANPSFLSGAARALDLYGTFDAYNGSSTEREADYKALSSDWHMVGQDIVAAMAQLSCSLPVDRSVGSDESVADERQMSFFQ
ncbi:MAG TPA: hypothetical protein VMT67_06860 [Terriglobales bacterium]|nr:hypothetical protein [Terriglobales bacterium]